jgi:hypothetical protein
MTPIRLDARQLLGFDQTTVVGAKVGKAGAKIGVPKKPNAKIGPVKKRESAKIGLSKKPQGAKIGASKVRAK